MQLIGYLRFALKGVWVIFRHGGQELVPWKSVFLLRGGRSPAAPVTPAPPPATTGWTSDSIEQSIVFLSALLEPLTQEERVAMTATINAMPKARQAEIFRGWAALVEQTERPPGAPPPDAAVYLATYLAGRL